MNVRRKMRLFFARRHFLSCGRRRPGCAAAKRKRTAAERPHMPTVARPSVPAARESAARPNGIFSQPKPAAGLARHGNLLQKRESAAKTRRYFSGILFLPLMRGPLCTEAPALAGTRHGEPHCRRADLSALCAGKRERQRRQKS